MKVSERFNRKPKWPTLKQGACLPSLSQFVDKDTTYLLEGFKVEYENEHGGLFAGDIETTYRAVSLERRMYVKRKGRSLTTPLYFLVMMSEYRHGVIMHIGIQYPHCASFEDPAVEKAAFEVYRWVVTQCYSDIGAWPAEVRNFIKGDGPQT